MDKVRVITYVRWCHNIIAKIATETYSALRRRGFDCARAMAHNKKRVKTQCGVDHNLEVEF